MTFLLLAVVYLSGPLYAWGTTGAKVVYGLEVNADGTKPARLLRIVARETVGKALSVGVVLILGGVVFFAVVSIRALGHVPYAIAIPIVLGLSAMIFAALLQRKRAIHDLLTGTRVSVDRWRRLG